MREPSLDLEQARFLSPKDLVCRLPWVHLVETTVAKIQVLTLGKAMLHILVNT